ncbi:peptidoglycan-binding domain-containing protein [Propylenella binzhouense]|uniref:Peptidoglycan-binding protein n=1 Tax=Propylenella binzhouense TaxID=2555902 RepID=A0A964T8G0_9HYPH|nr:peptidoglycan-binding domain-containing protein [Propylenella binzhouense]MYZ50483.1 peptidoglycan-binding protein [Propylenella binzhouense]
MPVRLRKILFNGRSALAAGVLCVSAAVAANALYGQANRHPAPLFATRSDESFRSAAAIAPETIQAVQLALLQAGLYDGPLDGRTGPKTRQAVAAYQREAGLAVTGEPSEALLASLAGADAPAEPAARPPEPAESRTVASAEAEMPHAQPGAPPDSRIMAVQRALEMAAYGPLTPDGILGPQTREAITRFQADNGLPATGTIDDRLIERLRSVGAMSGV